MADSEIEQVIKAARRELETTSLAAIPQFQHTTGMFGPTKADPDLDKYMNRFDLVPGQQAAERRSDNIRLGELSQKKGRQGWEAIEDLQDKMNKASQIFSIKNPEKE